MKVATKARVLNFDFFMSLSNIINELKYFGTYEPVDIWNKYCDYINSFEEHRKNPSSHIGFNTVTGLQLDEIQHLYKTQGLALVFLHYGAYRHAAATILETAIKVHPEKPVLVVVDQESYNSESQLEEWVQIYSKLNAHMVIAENPSSGLKIARHLKNGGIVVLYLDGMTGYGKDKSSIRLPFISSEVEFRSGFFRLLQKSKTPVIGAITPSENELLISKPIISDDISMAASALMSFFRQTLLNDPSKWRMWYRHHLFVEALPQTLMYQETRKNKIHWICDEVTPKIILEEETGDVYQLETYR